MASPPPRVATSSPIPVLALMVHASHMMGRRPSIDTQSGQPIMPHTIVINQWRGLSPARSRLMWCAYRERSSRLIVSLARRRGLTLSVASRSLWPDVLLRSQTSTPLARHVTGQIPRRWSISSLTSWGIFATNNSASAGLLMLRPIPR